MQSLFNATKTKNGINRFFYETFRRHTKEEYVEFFTRNKNGERYYKTYPFVYLRAFVILLVIFAISAIVSEFTLYDTLYPFAVLLGGLVANIPVFLFIYEVYPGKDVGFLKYFLAFLIGGFVSIVFSLLVYYVYSPENEWLSALYTGIIEEIFKLIPAIAIIFAFRNKNPLFGFLIGAAVGAGTSVIEDMAYASRSAGFFFNDFVELIEVSVTRGVSSCCTHTIWTAFVGWAFAKFRRPLINFRFYLVVIASIALHFLWDLPLNDFYSFFVCLGCGIVGLVLAIIIVYKERAKLFNNVSTAAEEEVQPVENVIEKPFNLSQTANIVAAACLTVLAVFTLGLCVSDYGFWSSKEVYFDSREELIDYVQGGLDINVDRERKYIDEVENYAYTYEDGQLTEATQRLEEEVNGILYEYYYIYYFSYDEETNERNEELYAVWIKVDGVRYAQITHWIAGEDLIYYEVVNCNVWYDEEKEKFYIDEYCDEYFKGLTESIIIGSIMGVIFIGGSSAFITLKIKHARNKYER